MLLERKVERVEPLLKALERALEMADRIKACKREYESFLVGLEGGFVEPGPSGSITRGKIEILPTGRNFFAVDPTALPTRAAWRVGVETAEKLIRHYYDKYRRYPESVGQVLWSIDGYKADGEQLAQILHMLGVRPIWTSGGSVKGVEVIPIEELGRPRIDVVVRISGIVRDTLPNYIYLIDEAVSKVVALNEPIELNYPRKHYLERLEKLRSTGGDEEVAKCRVWCSPPGTYGSGTNLAVEASAWKGDEDLAKVWVQWSCYMYTRNSFGKPSPEGLLLSLQSVDVVTRNHISDEHDVLGCCCYFSYHGGFYNAVKSLTGRGGVELSVVDTKDVTYTEVRDAKDEIERAVRAKLLNPKWISEMKKHGYRGASEFSKKILHLYGWSATAKVVDKWVFDEIAKTYALDEDMRRWFEENNVWALEEIARRLLEAAERGLWKADEELLRQLKEVYAEVEGILEDDISGESEVQGSNITWFSPEEVERWKDKLANVAAAWNAITKEVKGDGGRKK